MFRKFLIAPVCITVLLYTCACADSPMPALNRDTTITVTTAFNELFIDSTYLDSFLLSKHPYQNYTKQYKDFYTGRNYEFAWFDSSGLAEQAHNFYNLQNNYIATSGDSSLYNDPLHQLYDNINAQQVIPGLMKQQVLQLEMMLTGQFFRYAAQLYKGAGINPAELGWYIPRKKIDLTALLDSVIQNGKDDPEHYVHINRLYKSLETELARYIELEKKETNDQIPKLKKPLKKGDTSVVVPLVKSRLALLQGDLFANNSNLYDADLEEAVKTYQRRNGLSEDGIISNGVIGELNVPLKKRVQQILVNMERARWLPVQPGSNFVMVNIPEFKLHVLNKSQQELEMKVIVGSALHNTVIFTAQLQYIVFSPYWNVPPSITRNEILPAIRRNGNYLSRNHMEITGYVNGLPEIRQKPGEHNSLGLVKFLFPNNYNIYLHDTPGKHLFNQAGRGFSHGCIRIEEPRKFAEYLLRNEPEYTSEVIDSLMHLGKEKWVVLKKTLPVFLVYFTAWVDQEGVLNFRKDIYGHDEKMMKKLFNN